MAARFEQIKYELLRFGLQTELGDDLSPFRRLRRNIGGVFLGRPRGRLGAFGLDARFHLGGIEGLAQNRIELRDDRRRRARPAQ